MKCGQAPIIKVVEVIRTREQTLVEIAELSVTYTDKDNEKAKEMEDLLLSLRSLSIRTVELIVLWRDQFRYLALMSTKMKLQKKRLA